MSKNGEAIYTQMILEEKIEIKPEDYKMTHYPKHEIVQITKSLSFYEELLLNGSNDFMKEVHTKVNINIRSICHVLQLTDLW